MARQMKRVKQMSNFEMTLTLQERAAIFSALDINSGCDDPAGIFLPLFRGLDDDEVDAVIRLGGLMRQCFDKTCDIATAVVVKGHNNGDEPSSDSEAG
jgi:hypothetical protein